MSKMIKKTLVLGALQTNCYLITNSNTMETIIIDPADNADKIIQKIEEQKMKPVAIFFTHGHYDHITAALQLKETYNINIYCHSAEKELCESIQLNLSYKIGRKEVVVSPDILLYDNQEIEIADFQIKVLYTPGHTSGSVCYYFYKENKLFSGDMLFRESIGRTDFETGDYATILVSLREKLMVLDEKVEVFTGHGMGTTIGHEKQYNPYVHHNEVNETW